MLRSLFLLLLAAPAQAADYHQLVDRYYQEWAARRPVAATELGWHDHDAELDDVSQAGMAKLIDWLHGWQKEWAKVDAAKLSPAEQLDLEAVKLGVESQLVSAETIGWWRRRPDYYANL